MIILKIIKYGIPAIADIKHMITSVLLEIIIDITVPNTPRKIIITDIAIWIFRDFEVCSI